MSEPRIIRNADLAPCPFCGARLNREGETGGLICYEIPPHQHYYFGGRENFEGAFYVECVYCEIGMSDAELFDLTEKWNKRVPIPETQKA